MMIRIMIMMIITMMMTTMTMTTTSTTVTYTLLSPLAILLSHSEGENHRLIYSLNKSADSSLTDSLHFYTKRRRRGR